MSMCGRCGEHRSQCMCHLECEDCNGTGRESLGQGITKVCPACNGLGYKDEGAWADKLAEEVGL